MIGPGGDDTARMLVQVGLDGVGTGRVAVPADWTATPDGQERVAFPDPGRYVGQGFLPNITVRIDPQGAPDEIPVSDLILSDRLQSGEDGNVLRIRMTMSNLDGLTLMQMFTTVEAGDVRLTLVSSATEEQWDGLADELDVVAASATIVPSSTAGTSG